MPVNTPDLSPLGGGNDALTAEAHISSVARLSLQTIGTALSPALTFESDRSLGFYRSAASTIAQSYGTFSLPSGITVVGAGVFGSGVSVAGIVSTNTLSMLTYGAASGMTRNQLILVFNASGISLAYSSGASMYFFGGSTISGVQS